MLTGPLSLSILCHFLCIFLFFFNDTATTEIYTLSLHDALPISDAGQLPLPPLGLRGRRRPAPRRSEEHTSELQSQFHLVCLLLLEKKKTTITSSCIWFRIKLGFSMTFKVSLN